MTIILNDIWPLFNSLIQSDLTTDTRKEIAINVAMTYLVKRMIELGKSPDDFVSDPTNLSNTGTVNYLSLPSDFLALHRVWRREGDRFIPLGVMSIMTYPELLDRVGENFFDPTDTASPLYAAIKEPYIYLDRYIKNTFWGTEVLTDLTSLATTTVTDQSSDTTITVASTTGFVAGHVISGGTSGVTATIVSVDSTTSMTITVIGGSKEIKITYFKSPYSITVYDTMATSSESGAFTVGETIYGAMSGATATIIALGVHALNIVITSGDFQVGETITGETSSKTATAGVITLKPTSIPYSVKYKEILSECSALWWFHQKGSSEVEARSAIVDNMIKMLSVVNQQEAQTQWGTM